MADNDKLTDNPISRGVELWHRILPSPMLRAVVYGAGAYGATRALWDPLMDTTKSLGRPLRQFAGMSSAEWDAAIEEARQNSDVRR